MRINGFYLIGFALALPHFSCASESTAPHPMSPDRVNLSAADYLNYVRSADVQQRQLALAYVLGVLDTTEGVKWCSYQKFKTVTLREIIFEELKKMDDTALGKRASFVISNILEENLPYEVAK